MQSQETHVYFRHYCPRCDGELSDPTRLINRLNKVEKRKKPSREACTRRPTSSDYLYVKVKAEAQFVLDACISCNSIPPLF